MEPKALIFDCDGTLVNTMPLHWRAWRIISERHGLHFPEERFYAYGGVPTRDILKILAEEQGKAIDPLAVAYEKEEAFLDHLDAIEPIHAVVEIAREHAGKLPMAVASGGTQKVITMILDKLEIRHLFRTVVTSEHVRYQKPAPDIFLEAAARLRVEPQFCRAYEDSDLGLKAIRAAGMEAVDVRLALAGAGV
jgi:HAD superfamily hydrolase (TIGR01509 family)